MPHVYFECDCKSIKSVTSNGYKIEGYQFDQNNGAVFISDYPTSSPYGNSVLQFLIVNGFIVTSVGATQFLVDENQNIIQEVACTIQTGGLITTGGGFSSFQPIVRL